MDASYKHDFTENLEAVARGLRRLEDVRDPELRDAIRAALGLAPEQQSLDATRRARMRRAVLTVEPTGVRLSDRLVALMAVVAFPAPYAVRAFALAAVAGAALAGAAVASADSLPDDALYPVKAASEQVRLALAVAPADRAAVELSLAEYRLDEAERLAAAGRESGALVATSAYAAHLASAAAELADVDELAPRALALVKQLEARLADQRARAADATERLLRDPRTALAGVVLSAIASAPDGNGPTAASRIADSASAVSARLAAVAEERANGGQPLVEALDEILGKRPVSGPIGEEDLAEEDVAAPETAPLFVVPPGVPTAPPVTSAPGVRATGTRGPTSGIAAAGATTRTAPAATARSATTARPAASARPTVTPRVTAARATASARSTAKPSVDPSARIAAERTKESAAKAKAALEKAKEAAKRTPKPAPKR